MFSKPESDLRAEESHMRVVIVLGFVGTSLVALGSDVPRSVSDPRPEPEPVGPDWYPCDYRGRVVEMTKTGVVIKPEGVLKIYEIRSMPDGTTRERVYIQDETKPPREFTFADTLFPNRPGSKRAMGWEHWPADVRVGDIIWISCHQFAGKDYCSCIRIQRRPGGRVPPAIGDDKTSEKGRLDNIMNAQQFQEETFIPRMLPWMVLNLR